MKDREQLSFLIENLLDEMPPIRSEARRTTRDGADPRYLLRCLMNVREP